jgi:hypothetical protein
MAQNFCAFSMLANGKLSCSISPLSSILAIAQPFSVFVKHRIVALWFIVDGGRNGRWERGGKLLLVVNALGVLPDNAHGS